MKHNFYPVIHVKGISHAYENALVAFHNKADGIFLINMGDTTQEILQESFERIYIKFGHQFKIGINYLRDLDQINWSMPPSSMLWSDTLDGYSEDLSLVETQFFAPYRFKYQPVSLVDNLPKVEKIGDIITTSGDGTGKPPTLEKIQMIHKVAKKPIAVASGISAENVRQFKPYARDFLVGTSIGYHNLIPEKVKELANIIHE